MPFCPECGFEYSEDVFVCPECRIELVKHLPDVGGPAAMAPDDSWVGVCSVDDDLPTETIRGLLDSNNIPSIVTTSIFQPRGNGEGFPANRRVGKSDGQVVMVPREFRDEAELLLTAILGDDYGTIGIREQ